MGNRLKDRVAVVTGSGQGIGKAIALAMAKEGAGVVTNNRRPGSTGVSIYGEEFTEKFSSEETEQALRLSGDAETTAEEIKEMGGKATAFFGDVSDFNTAEKLIQKAVDSFGRVDILVNNAGTFSRGFIWELSEDAWDYVVLAKLKGTFNCTRHAVGLMKEQGWGRILNCTSGAWLGNMEHSNYSAANAGVVGLTRSVAMELFKYGVTCNAYAPLAMTRALIGLAARTRIMAEAGITIRGERGESTAATALEATVGPEGIAQLVTYLATEEAAQISGTVFRAVGNEFVIYSEPEEKKRITKKIGQWTIDELVKAVPRGLLEGYVGLAAD